MKIRTISSIDHRRGVVGRPQGPSDRTADVEVIARRNLAALVADDLDLDQIPERASKRPDADLIRRERAEQLAAALGELTPKDQLLLTLRYVDDHSPEKVARMLAYSSRFAVHRRLRSLLATLRRRLEDQGFEP